MTIASQLGVECLGRSRARLEVYLELHVLLHLFPVVGETWRELSPFPAIYMDSQSLENMGTVRFTVCAAGKCGQREMAAHPQSLPEDARTEFASAVRKV